MNRGGWTHPRRLAADAIRCLTPRYGAGCGSSATAGKYERASAGAGPQWAEGTW